MTRGGGGEAEIPRRQREDLRFENSGFPPPRSKEDLSENVTESNNRKRSECGTKLGISYSAVPRCMSAVMA